MNLWKSHSASADMCLSPGIMGNTSFWTESTRTAHLTCVLLPQKPDSTAVVVTATVHLVLVTLTVLYCEKQTCGGGTCSAPVEAGGAVAEQDTTVESDFVTCWEASCSSAEKQILNKYQMDEVVSLYKSLHKLLIETGSTCNAVRSHHRSGGRL